MLTLFSYPDLCGVADNNPYRLKVYAFLKLCNLAFRHEHIFDASNAPRGQLPYVVDGDETNRTASMQGYMGLLPRSVLMRLTRR